jgi:transcriptional regulator with AAA-type ATPase domain
MDIKTKKLIEQDLLTFSDKELNTLYSFYNVNNVNDLINKIDFIITICNYKVFRKNISFSGFSRKTYENSLKRIF